MIGDAIVANITVGRKSGFVVRGGSRKRETRWLDGVPVRTGFAAGASSLAFTLTAVELAYRPFTVTRTRGLIGIKSDQVAATEPFQIGLGMCVVSDQALAIGVTAVPTPITDMGSDLWFLHELVFGEILVASAASIEGQGSVNKYFDSKAMRKVDDGQDIAIVTEVPSSASSEGLVRTLGFRMLIKLH